MTSIEVGVGLRHAHYQAAFEEPANIDFVEVHSENFYAKGGATQALLQNVFEQYAVSFHGTSMGLGSLAPIPPQATQKLVDLCSHYSPKFISDHACFNWGHIGLGPAQEQLVHGGDLLPIAFNSTSLQNFADNVEALQDQLKRPILIENLSAYLAVGDNTLDETEFLNALCEKTGCGLILDINNLIVNAHNQQIDAQPYAEQYIKSIRSSAVQEIHLAGCTPMPIGEIMVDDHAMPVPDAVWQAYSFAMQTLGSRPTLVEWDNALPSWQTLIAEADKARSVATQALATRPA